MEPLHGTRFTLLQAKHFRVKEPLPRSKDEFKHSLTYCLQSEFAVSKSEALHPDAKIVGLFKGTEKIYLRTDVHPLRPLEEWRKRGRRVKLGEKGTERKKPLSKEVEVLFGVWQTEEVSELSKGIHAGLVEIDNKQLRYGISAAEKEVCAVLKGVRNKYGHWDCPRGGGAGDAFGEEGLADDFFGGGDAEPPLSLELDGSIVFAQDYVGEVGAVTGVDEGNGSFGDGVRQKAAAFGERKSCPKFTKEDVGTGVVITNSSSAFATSAGSSAGSSRSSQFLQRALAANAGADVAATSSTVPAPANWKAKAKASQFGNASAKVFDSTAPAPKSGQFGSQFARSQFGKDALRQLPPLPPNALRSAQVPDHTAWVRAERARDVCRARKIDFLDCASGWKRLGDGRPQRTFSGVLLLAEHAVSIRDAAVQNNTRLKQQRAKKEQERAKKQADDERKRVAAERYVRKKYGN